MVGVRSGGGLRQIQDLFARGAVGHLTDAQLLDRFAQGHDADAAFEALVVRHGPAVLRVCRRALRDPNDADDAFQATFLVLARRARAVGCPDSLASWLYGVALRVSRKANIATARRRRHEQLAAGGRIPDREPLHDIVSIVREEIALLPEPLRLPVHLCYLEGETYEVAARHLRVTEATIRGRLARARNPVPQGCLPRRGGGGVGCPQSASVSVCDRSNSLGRCPPAPGPCDDSIRDQHCAGMPSFGRRLGIRVRAYGRSPIEHDRDKIEGGCGRCRGARNRRDWWDNSEGAPASGY